MAICKYIAPNGEKSELAANLEQFVGPDITAQMWNFARTNMDLFKTLDKNGEPIAGDVRQNYRDNAQAIADMEKFVNGDNLELRKNLNPTPQSEDDASPKSAKPKAPAVPKTPVIMQKYDEVVIVSPIEIVRDKTKKGDRVPKDEVQNNLQSIYDKALANPRIQYLINFQELPKESTTYKSGYTPFEIANFLTGLGKLPPNVAFTPYMSRLLEQSSFMIGLNMVMEDQVQRQLVNFDGVAKTEQMNTLFVPLVDDAGNQIGNFKPEHQAQAADAVLRTVYLQYIKYPDRPLSYVLSLFMGWINQEAIKAEQAGNAERSQNFRNLLNSFAFNPQEKRVSISELALLRLESYGLTISNKEAFMLGLTADKQAIIDNTPRVEVNPAHISDFDAYISALDEDPDLEDPIIGGAEGTILRRYDEVVFQLDPKDTASWRIKLLLSSLKTAELSYLKLETLVNFEQTYQRLLGLLEGGDRTYAQMKTKMLEAATIHPEFTQLIDELDRAGNEHLRREFTKVMSVHYQKYMMATHRKRSVNGIDTWILNPFDSNRGGEILGLVSKWKEQQKLAPVMKVVGSERVMDPTLMEPYVEWLRFFNHDWKALDAIQGHIDALQESAKSKVRMDFKSKKMVPTQEGEILLKSIESQENNLYYTAERELKFLELVNKTIPGLNITGYKNYAPHAIRIQSQIMREILALNGIDFSEAMAEDLIKNQKAYLKNTGLDSLWAVRDDLGVSSGLLPIFVLRVTGDLVAKENVEESTGDETATFKKHNPLYSESKILGVLAKVYATHSDILSSASLKTVENKIVFDYVQNTSLSLKMQEVFQEPLRDAKGNPLESPIHILKNNFILNHINRAHAGLSTLDGLRGATKERGVTRTDMSDREQEVLAISLFQNRNKERGHYLSLTHSDKATSPIFANFPKIKTGARSVSKDAVVEMFNVFNAEYTRIVAHANEDFNHVSYNVGNKIFLQMPQFNYEMMMEMVDSGKVLNLGKGNPRAITAEDVQELWTVVGDSYELKEAVTTGAKNVINGLLLEHIDNLTNETVARWEHLGITDPKRVAFAFDQDYFRSLVTDPHKLGFVIDGTIGKGKDAKRMFSAREESGLEKLSSEDAYFMIVQAAARDFAVNYFLINTAVANLAYGDPAQALKFKKEQVDSLTGKILPSELASVIDATMKEYAKRLAKDIAPGQDLAWEEDQPTYKSVTMADVTTVEDYIIHPDLANNYRSVNGTDAQELTTVREHLDMHKAAGTVTEAVYNDMIAIVTKGEKKADGWYEFKDEAHMKILLSPTKPVYAGMRPNDRGAEFVDYIKSMAYPLYPPMTANREIDKLRHKMEAGGDFSKTVRRAVFASSHKVGQPRTSVEVFNKQGHYTLADDGSWENSIVSLQRKNFRIQQEVPFDEYKTSIGSVTQMDKLIVEGISHLGPDVKFDLNGTQVSGAELKAAKEKIRIELMDRKLAQFRKEVGLTDDGKVLNKTTLIEKLVEEATRRNFSVNEIAALKYFTEDGELEIPLLYSAAVNKFESSLMSIVKNLVKIDMPGRSYVQGSSVGYVSRQQMRTADQLTDADKRGITYVQGYDSTQPLKSMEIVDGKVKPAQVVVAFNFLFRDEFGNNVKAKLEDFLIEVDGISYLDTSKVPKELLQMVGARVPTQKHSSMLAIEIVGFLPASMGDLMLVPSAITTQMGADFDVDKLYTYHRPYTYRNGKFKEDRYTADKTKLGATPEEYKDLIKKTRQKIGKDWKTYSIPDFNKVLGTVVKETYPDGNVPEHTVPGLPTTRSAVKAAVMEAAGHTGTETELQDMPETADITSSIEATLTSNREKAPKVSDDHLRNMYFDTHWAVLTNLRMYKEVLAPLDKKDLQEENDALAPPRPHFYNYYSAVAQFSDFQSAKDAKQLVALTSLTTTFNSVIQDKGLSLGIVVPTKTDFKTIHQPIKFHKEDGTTLELSKLSGYGTSTYKNQTRTKQDNITTIQTAAVDNPKNRHLDNLNLNTYTYDAAAALLLLEDERGNAVDLRYVTRLLAQPAIKELVKRLVIGNDSLTQKFVPDLFDKTLEELRQLFLSRNKVTPEEYDAFKIKNSVHDPASVAGKFFKDMMEFKFNPESLLAEFKKPTNAGQFAILNMFEKLQKVGTRVAELQSLFNQDTKGGGKGLLEALDKERKFEKHISVGEGTRSTGILNEESIIDGGRSETYHIFKGAIDTSIDIIGALLPYEQLGPTLNSLQAITRKDQISIETQRNILAALKSYSYSGISALWPNSFEERFRLLHDTDAGPSFAKRVEAAKRTWGSENYLLKRLYADIGNNYQGPDFITFDSNKKDMLDDQLNVVSLMDMLSSENREERLLAEDLVRYAYLTGGNHGPKSFVNKIPVSYLVDTDFSRELRHMQQTIIENLDGENFLEQFLQHHPDEALAITDEEFTLEGKSTPEYIELSKLKKGKPLEKAHERFLNEDPLSPHPYVKYISFYNDSTQKKALYKLIDDSTYIRIDTLGLKGTSEFNYNNTGQVNRSVFTENRALGEDISANFPTAELDNAVTTLKTTLESGKDFYSIFGMPKNGGGIDTVHTMLESIGSDAEVKTSLRTVADILSSTPELELAMEELQSLYNSKVELHVEFDDTMEAAGKYNRKTGRILLSRLDSDRNANAETFLHELLHHRTVSIIALAGFSTHLNRQGIDNPLIKNTIDTHVADFTKAVPEAARILTAMDKLRYQAFTEFRNRVVKEHGEEYFNNMVVGAKKSDLSSEELLLYALSNLEEFVTHVFTNTVFQKFLNGIQVNQKVGPTGKLTRTLLEMIQEMFANLLEAVAKTLGTKVHKDHLLHEALLLTLKLNTLGARVNPTLQIENAIEHNQPVITDTEQHALRSQQILQSYFNKDTAVTTDGMNHIVSVEDAKRRGKKPTTILEYHIQLAAETLADLEKELLKISQTVTKTTPEGARHREALLQEREKFVDALFKLRQEGNEATLAEVGKEQIAWVNRIMEKANPTTQEVLIAMRTLDTWATMLDTIYAGSEEIPSISLELSGVIGTAQLIKSTKWVDKSHKVFVKMSKTFGIELTPEDFTTGLKDINSAEGTWLTADRQESRLLSGIATVGKRHAEIAAEEIMDITARIQKLQETIQKAVGKSSSAAQNLYDQFIQQGEDKLGWGLVQRYAPEWYKFRSKADTGLENDLSVARGEKDPTKRATRRAKAYDWFWKTMEKESAIVDIRGVLDPETGELVKNEASDKVRKKLMSMLDDDAHVEEAILEAQTLYKQFLEKKKSAFEAIDEEYEGMTMEDAPLEVLDAVTAEIMEMGSIPDDVLEAEEDRIFEHLLEQHREAKKKKWEAFSSPIKFLDKKQLGDAVEEFGNSKYLHFMPKAKFEKYYDKNFADLQKDENKWKKDIFTELVAIRDELTPDLPENIVKKAGKNFLPAMTKDVMFDMLGKLGSLKPSNVANRVFQATTISYSEFENKGKEATKIPVRYFDHWEAPKDTSQHSQLIEERRKETLLSRSRDIPRILEVFANMALHYKHMSKVLGYVEVGESILKQIHVSRLAAAKTGKEPITAIPVLLDTLDHWKKALFFQESKRVEAVVDAPIYSANIKKHKATLSDLKVLNEGIAELREKAVTDTLSSDEKDELLELLRAVEEITQEGRYLTGSKVLDSAISFNQLRALAWNPFAAVTNISFGWISVYVHGNGRVDYDNKSARQANGIMMHAWRRWFTMGKWDDSTSQKILHLSERMDLMSGTAGNQYGESGLPTHRKKGAGRVLSPLQHQHSGDYFTKGMMMVAMMKFKKVKVTEGGVEKEISLWDAHNDKGEWDSVKYGPQPEWTSDIRTEQTEFIKFRSKVKKVSTLVFGNQDRNSPLKYKRSALLRALGQFRGSWLPEGIATRFQKQRYDHILERTVKGRYLTLWGGLETDTNMGGFLTGGLVLIKQAISTLPFVQMDAFKGVRSKGSKVLEDVDRENMRRNFTGIATSLAFAMAMLALTSLAFPDDEEKKSRRKGKKKATHPGLYLTYNMLMRNYQDLMLYSSPSVFDVVLRKPLPVMALLTDSWDALTKASLFFNDDPKEVAKAWRAWAKMFPLASNFPKWDYMTARSLTLAK